MNSNSHHVIPSITKTQYEYVIKHEYCDSMMKK